MGHTVRLFLFHAPTYNMTTHTESPPLINETTSMGGGKVRGGSHQPQEWTTKNTNKRSYLSTVMMCRMMMCLVTLGLMVIYTSTGTGSSTTSMTTAVTTANTALLRGNNGNDTDGDKDKNKDTDTEDKSATKPDDKKVKKEDKPSKQKDKTAPKKKKKKKKEDTPKEDEGSGYGINPNFVPADLPRGVNPNFVPT